MKHSYFIDFVRSFAIIGVLVVHVFENIYAQMGFDILKFSTLFTIERLFRFAVPLFFILSGYTLTYRYGNNIISLLQFYKKRILRLFIPYLFWSVFYVLMRSLSSIQMISLQSIALHILNGSASIHLYFIPSLLLLIVLFPLFISYNKQTLLYVFIIITIVDIGLLIRDYYFGAILNFDPLRIMILTLPLFLLGIVTRQYEDSIRKWVTTYRFYLFLATIISGYVVIEMSRSLFLSSKNVEFINSQWQPYMYLYTIFIWYFLFSLPQSIYERIKTWISSLAHLSYFIYFIHIFILSIFWRFIGSSLFISSSGHVAASYWFAPSIVLFVFSISYFIGFIVQKIPYIPNILGIERKIT
jgi:probable poly-beta-1,6-N-acetyl-D-glucosamine export protein